MIGDHIRTLKAGRWTHAIDCGDETVVVLPDDAAQPPRVRRSYRPEFVAGAEAVEVVRHRERTFPAEEVVARAYSRIADPALASMFRDSEAFAEWCTTGRLPVAPPSMAIPVPEVAPAATAAPSSKAVRPPAARAKAATKGKPVRSARTARGARPAVKAKPARKPRPAAKAKGARKTARKSGRVAKRTASPRPRRRGRR